MTWCILCVAAYAPAGPRLASAGGTHRVRPPHSRTRPVVNEVKDEEQQERVIRLLMEKLGMDAGAIDKVTLDAVEVASSRHETSQLQKENAALQDQLNEWNKHFTWAAEQVRLRDALLERVDEAKAEVAKAEEQVEPLRAECKKLEMQQQSERARKSQVEGAKNACERTLVTLPTDIATLRESIGRMESELAELQPALDTLQEEQATLSARQEQLETELSGAEAELVAQRAALDDAHARVAQLTASTAEALEAIETGKGTLTELEEEEEEMAAAYGPLTVELQTIRNDSLETAKRLARLQKRNDTLEEALRADRATLASGRAAYEEVKTALRATRMQLSTVRRERNQCAADDTASRKEIDENESLCTELLREMEALKAEAPALIARKAAAASALEEALAAVERFESGPMAETLALAADADKGAAAADGGATAGVGADVDERIARSARLFEGTQEEVEERLRALSAFSDSALEAMNAAAARRDSAQRTLELLAAEQRRATAEMQLTLNAALEAMGTMQSQWDAAVDANAEELRDLRSDAAKTAEKQAGKADALERMRTDLASQAKALGALSDERRSVEEEEERLRRRYAQLSQRRKAKLRQQTEPLVFASKLPVDTEELLEAAGANAEKAVVELFRMFKSKEQGESKGGDGGSAGGKKKSS